ncbi:MAG: type II secretion system inner membrane protein GspF [Gammaproteobacteria bacterium]|nr:type II secretion system inner membrane protein GspF [Gammaproteobacteria bacterium]MBU1414870.1 type II secretion system inner membrane protein GspF [Gammaproteobacteria bacterium]
MTAFRYRALDDTGKKTAGVVEAESAREARAILRDRGWFPMDIEDFSGRRSFSFGSFGRGLRAAELCLLTRQWATLLISGLTMEQSLTTMIEQAEREAVRGVLTGLRREIVGGASLRAALERFPVDFPAIYRASVAAGEKSGELSKVMLQLADHLEQRSALRQKTIQALVYPVLVASVAMLVVIGLMTYVVPSVVSVFQQGRQELPWLTRALIAISAFIREWGWLVLLAMIGAGFGLRLAFRDEGFRMRWDTRLLGLPVLGPYLRNLDATRFASTLSILASSGVPLLEALEACSRVVVRLPLVAAIGKASGQVREGMPLSRALMQTRQFPPILVHMIASGEATGRLGALLERAAQLQQADVENRTAMFTVLIEPIMLLTMGGLVLLIVLAVMQPIIELNVLIH